VRGSRVARLGQVADLFRDHAEDLAAFLSAHEKGQRLPAYLIGLAEHLTGEQEVVLEELKTLTCSVEHIKSIISMQQRHASNLAVVEPLQITDVLEDVLRMHAAAFVDHGITVIRDYADVPIALLDRHAVLQVLVNLVGNAKHALRDGSTAQKLLTLRVSRPTDGTLRVEMCDTGVGIAAENLPRLWEYGFTTKKDGHGFGLHNSALAAKALGGSLHAHSAGPGRGTTFTLEMPLRIPETTHG
jgi:signal transduction histidine kinase